MQGRNPFTSINNYSFVRNANKLPSNRKASHSSSLGKRYFDYQGSYYKDSYLQDWQNRHQQQTLSSRVMGIEALRYTPEVPPKPDFMQSTGEYYNLQTFGSSQPTSLPLKSQPDHNHMKCSTRDMFGSDYFNNHNESSEDERLDSYQVLVRKSSIHKKKSNGNRSRFKETQEIKWQEEEEKQEEQYEECPKMNTVQSKDSIVQTQNQNEDPPTLFLKSRGTLFYLYQNPYEDYN